MRVVIAAIAMVFMMCGSVLALDVLEPGYSTQVYGSFSNANWDNGSMAFDGSGNLYMGSFSDGNVWRISPGGSATVFVSGLNMGSGIKWAGGTSYGNYLYITSGNNLNRVGTDGTVSQFASGFPATSEVAVDRTGKYGGYLYVSTGGQDHIYRVTTGGSVSMWSNWPGWTDGGGPTGLDFDTTGNYGYSMYVATNFNTQANAYKSGLFALDTVGNATRFSPELAEALELSFDTTGLFGNRMYVIASEALSSNYSVWKVNYDGSATKFAVTTADSLRSITFGSDGAMYVSEQMTAGNMVTVTRVVPEPCTILLLGLGAVAMRSGKRSR